MESEMTARLWDLAINAILRGNLKNAEFYLKKYDYVTAFTTKPKKVLNIIQNKTTNFLNVDDCEAIANLLMEEAELAKAKMFLIKAKEMHATPEIVAKIKFLTETENAIKKAKAKRDKAEHFIRLAYAKLGVNELDKAEKLLIKAEYTFSTEQGQTLLRQVRAKKDETSDRNEKTSRFWAYLTYIFICGCCRKYMRLNDENEDENSNSRNTSSNDYYENRSSSNNTSQNNQGRNTGYSFCGENMPSESRFEYMPNDRRNEHSSRSNSNNDSNNDNRNSCNNNSNNRSSTNNTSSHRHGFYSFSANNMPSSSRYESGDGNSNSRNTSSNDHYENRSSSNNTSQNNQGRNTGYSFCGENIPSSSRFEYMPNNRRNEHSSRSNSNNDSNNDNRNSCNNNSNNRSSTNNTSSHRHGFYSFSANNMPSGAGNSRNQSGSNANHTSNNRNNGSNNRSSDNNNSNNRSTRNNESNNRSNENNNSNNRNSTQYGHSSRNGAASNDWRENCTSDNPNNPSAYSYRSESSWRRVFSRKNEKQKEQMEAMNRVLRSKADHEILGLGTTYTKDDVKKAFRRLSLLIHPDKNKAPQAKEAFLRANEAHERLMKKAQ